MKFDYVAHDLKTPLAALLGHTRMIASENLSPAGRRRLAIIEAQVERMAMLIDGYLLGAAAGDLVDEHAGKVVMQVSRELEPLVERAGVTLGLVVDEGVPQCRCAPAALHRVVLNILRNATDATAPGGTIECRIGGGASSEVFIEVRDSGRGIPASVLEHLFERGFTTKPSHQGHGLGLSICRELLHHQGGGMRINSRPGDGTRVLITLQAAAMTT